jgi:hypothetical protein
MRAAEAEEGGCMICLILRPDGRAGRFGAYLDGESICVSHQPLLDGARELLRRGHDPASLLTTRHEGKITTTSCRSRSASWPSGRL